MENVWDLLFQLVKHGTNTLHVVFIFLFSVFSMCGLVYLVMGHSRHLARFSNHFVAAYQGDHTFLKWVGNYIYFITMLRLTQFKYSNYTIIRHDIVYQ